jgi:site-specific DNA-methyltransferase (adenine-specific)
MGKDWDKAVPSVDIWKQCLRVLKPGAFAFIMSAPRMDVQTQMVMRIQEAGFDVAFTPLYWAYASGFPKAMNISKAVNKRMGAEREIIGSGTSKCMAGCSKRNFEQEARPYINGIPNQEEHYPITTPATPEAKSLNGSYAGFQPKPAVEVIIVAMKPLSEKTYIDQALANGKGITWLDDGRIPHGGDSDMGDWDRFKGHQSPDAIRKNFEDTRKDNFADRVDNGINGSGRFPANLLVSDDVLDDGKTHIGTGGLRPQRPSDPGTPFHEETNRPYFNYGDSGGFSRYFSLDKWAEQLPFFIVPKASKDERNKGLDGLEERKKWLPGCGGTGISDRENIVAKNIHPTVKPLKLMSYLITIGSRPGDLVMDPFAGSGTVCVAARNLGRHFIGYEISEEYQYISLARAKDAMAQKKLFEFVETEAIRHD